MSTISLENIFLEIPFVQRTGGSLTQAPLNLLRQSYTGKKTRKTRMLLNDISFTVDVGDRVALIGRNGAGKTTLLRLLAGVYVPSRGRLEISGEIQALFNVGVGFQNEASGLENIYLRGLAAGHGLDEIRRLVPEIVKFSGLGEAIYEPIRIYSAGMRLRLAFAVATSTQPDILLMDEWIGAGDQTFLDKARTRLMDRVMKSRAMVIASHNSALLREICNKTIVLEKGRLAFFGDLGEGLEYYQKGIRKMGVSESSDG